MTDSSARPPRGKTAHAIVAAIERKHQRFAAELHDGICQELTGIALTLDSLLKTIPQALAQTVRSVSEHVRRLAADTRRLAFGLAPLAIERTGLCGALRLLQQEIQTATSCSLVLDLNERLAYGLPNEIAGNLYRIALEASTNAIKHGRAKCIIVSLNDREPGLTFTIDDDGCGVQEAPWAPRGLGVYSMMSRAEWLGGDFKILSRIPQGHKEPAFNSP